MTYRENKQTKHTNILKSCKCRDTKIQIKSGTLLRQTNYSNYIQFAADRELYIKTQTRCMDKLEVGASGLDHPSISSCRIGACDVMIK